MGQFAAGSTLAPPASSPFNRFPQPPYDRTRSSVAIGTAPGGTLELEGGGCLELEGGGCLDLEDTVLSSVTQYRPGSVFASVPDSDDDGGTCDGLWHDHYSDLYGCFT